MWKSHPLDALNSTISTLPILGAISWYVNSVFFLTSFRDTQKKFDYIK